MQFVLSDASWCEICYYLDRSPLLTLQWVLGGSFLPVALSEEGIYLISKLLPTFKKL